MKECEYQRFLDFIFTFIALILLIPIFIIVIPLLSLTGEKKIFYTQIRIGMNKKKFRLLKFATMLEQSSLMRNGTLTVRDDSRILPIGKFLRKTKINELPQLINVLKGEMSIIGPRPLTIEALNSYSNDIKKIIFSTRPGLSGIGSIIFRNEEHLLSKNFSKKFFYKKIMPFKGELEVWFVKNKSITLYFKLIFLTIIVLFNAKTKLPFKLLKGLPIPNIDTKNFLFDKSD
jgi:lipopolysaccharide/colanic/teichoic acid biosynthesis glycosyltransferase